MFNFMPDKGSYVSPQYLMRGEIEKLKEQRDSIKKTDAIIEKLGGGYIGMKWGVRPKR